MGQRSARLLHAKLAALGLLLALLGLLLALTALLLALLGPLLALSPLLQPLPLMFLAQVDMQELSLLPLLLLLLLLPLGFVARAWPGSGLKLALAKRSRHALGLFLVSVSLLCEDTK